jgi:hypothetical protein
MKKNNWILLATGLFLFSAFAWTNHCPQEMKK